MAGTLGETRAKPLDVLMPGEGLGIVAADLIAERLPLHRLWLEPEPEAWLAEWGPRLRAVASSGHQFPIDAAFMRRLPRLEIVASFGVGYEHVEAKWAREHGVIVTHTPGVLDDEVADTAMALTLMAVRRLPQAERFLRAGEWLKSSFPLTASLRERTMGILGLGRIGRAIARRAESFGLKVAYHGRKPQPGVPHRFHASLIDMAKASDILMVTAPGGQETRHIVDAAVLRALGPDGVLVNIARGSLVDEKALIEALRDGTILAAGLDVFENEPLVPSELTALDNVVLLPHVGSGSVATRRAMAECVAANLFAWSEGEPPLTPVPETPWRGRWGQDGPSRSAANRKPEDIVGDRTSLIAGILAVMRNCWDLPADCNEGELFSYAEILLDRIEAGDSKDALYRYLADVQVKNLEMPMSQAYREIVDRAVELVKGG